jgi:hypothetical protein
MRLCLIAVLTTLPALIACAPPDFPEDSLYRDDGERDIPALEPIDGILATATQDEGRTADATVELQDRGARLRSRADALRQASP